MQNNMKIGVLTFHRSINYGAVTQCYALVSELKKRFPDDIVEVIDYVPQFRKDKYDPGLRNYLFASLKGEKGFVYNAKILASQIRRLLLQPNFLKLTKARYQAFQDSMKYLPLSEKHYNQNAVDGFRKAIYGKYDVIVVGSDCVWEWTSVPLPNAYYLCGDFGAHTHKLSLAASAGTDQVSRLNEEEKKLLRKSVSEFSYIGVRDTSTEYVLKQLEISGLKWHHNCDPTTFLDIALLAPYKDKVQARIKKLGIPNDKILIGIMGTERYAKIARQIFEDRAVYIALYVPNRFCDYQLLDLPVLEWACIFSLFDLTFTTFFHGTMLSLVNQTPVLSFDTLPETEHQITKLRELYNRLNLHSFYHRDDGNFSAEEMEQIGRIARMLVEDPPKVQIAEALQKEAATAESFFEHLEMLHCQKDVQKI